MTDGKRRHTRAGLQRPRRAPQGHRRPRMAPGQPVACQRQHLRPDGRWSARQAAQAMLEATLEAVRIEELEKLGGLASPWGSGFTQTLPINGFGDNTNFSGAAASTITITTTYGWSSNTRAA